jgi:hypothetical protein
MGDVLLSRDDLASVGVAFQHLQAVRGTEDTAVRRVTEHVEGEGIVPDLWGLDAVLVNTDPVMDFWEQIKGQLQRLWDNAWGRNKGPEARVFKDRMLAENLRLKPGASLEELIEARTQWNIGVAVE